MTVLSHLQLSAFMASERPLFGYGKVAEDAQRLINLADAIREVATSRRPREQSEYFEQADNAATGWLKPYGLSCVVSASGIQIGEIKI